jgi:hypothetical protein
MLLGGVSPTHFAMQFGGLLTERCEKLLKARVEVRFSACTKSMYVVNGRTELGFHCQLWTGYNAILPSTEPSPTTICLMDSPTSATTSAQMAPCPTFFKQNFKFKLKDTVSS